MENTLTIKTGDTDPKEYAQLVRKSITGVLKKLFDGKEINFSPDETTDIYYLTDLMEKLDEV